MSIAHGYEFGVCIKRNRRDMHTWWLSIIFLFSAFVGRSVGVHCAIEPHYHNTFFVVGFSFHRVALIFCLRVRNLQCALHLMQSRDPSRKWARISADTNSNCEQTSKQEGSIPSYIIYKWCIKETRSDSKQFLHNLGFRFQHQFLVVAHFHIFGFGFFLHLSLAFDVT